MGLIAGAVVWIAAGLLHILFVPRYLAFIDAQPCECSMEMPAEMAEEDMEDEDKMKEHKEMMDEHKMTCDKECPPKMECEIEKTEDMSEEDPMAACKAAMDEKD